MHAIIGAITAQLMEQTLIPPDVWLTRLTISAEGIISAPAKATFKARQQGIYYSFSGSCPMHYTLTFWQPRTPQPFKRHFGGSQGAHRFSETALMRFLAESGDLNPLHQGDMPVIPGLLIASWLLEHMAFQAPYVSIKFKSPLLVLQGFDLVETNEGYSLTDHKTIFAEVQMISPGDYDAHSEYTSE